MLETQLFWLQGCYILRWQVLQSSLFVHTTIISVGLSFLDSEHQRANGNLKYFEFQLEKQRKADEAEGKEPGKKETTEKKEKSKKVSNHQIPERKKYEMLCRGEGIKMVRETKRYTKT